jgi:hypothetical protein
MNNTTDNSTYYTRNKSDKGILVYDFIKDKDNTEFIYDVGCNNGNISYPLQTKLNKRVMGIDLSTDLIHPQDYNFERKDIVKSNDIVYNDCTLFLSVYHHLLGSYNIEIANDVFLKLLLRTKYLIFDTGNISEASGKHHNWYKVQKNIFSSERELINHFNLPYTTLGSWKCGGGTRSVVSFSSNDFDTSVETIQEYRRMNGSKHQIYGLINLEKCKNTKEICNSFVFKKLKWNNKILFSKKRPNNLKLEKTEYENIIKVYNNLDASNLIKFYGYSEKFGLIFEWLDDFKYMGKTKLDINGHILKDVDVIQLKDGTKKYIDFER